MPRTMTCTVVPLLLALACSAALAQAVPGATTTTRGQALYDTHCFACHTAQQHWRDKKLATDWDSLKALVRRWQATVGEFWGDADVVEVARYLNEAYYHFPQTSDAVVGLAPRPIGR